jgi:thiol-disulfide isomerase/thioredoxin
MASAGIAPADFDRRRTTRHARRISVSAMRRVLLWMMVAACTATLACSRGVGERAQEGRPAAPGSDATGPPVVRVTPAEFAAIVRRPSPAATLVNVWATWCEPCREEFPSLLKASRQRRAEGLRLVLVSADFADQLPAVRQFLAAHGVTDTTYLKSGDDMAFIDSLSARWSGALPATFVYDASGREIAFWEGRADEARFGSAIDAAMRSSRTQEGSRP